MTAARELVSHLHEVAEADTLRVVGSLRRKCAEVHDVDIVLVPKAGQMRDLLGHVITGDLLAVRLDALLRAEIIRPPDQPCAGQDIRRVIHTGTGVPVDIFSATHANYWSVVVCRTGPVEHNIRMIQRAKSRGLTWNPQRGFTDAAGHDFAPLASEEDFFSRLQLPYARPEERQ